MVELTRAEIFEILIPFRFTFGHSLASRHETLGLLVHVQDELGNSGWGECAPRLYVTGESMESVTQDLSRWIRELAPDMPDDLEACVDMLDAEFASLERDEHAAHCALELALLDLYSRRESRSYAVVLGEQIHRSVSYGAVLPSHDPSVAKELLQRTCEIGFRDLKLKVGADDDHALLALSRETLGPDVSIRVDANCAWDAETALTKAEQFVAYGVELIEQPLPAADVDGLAWLTARSPVPIAVDESLVSVADALRLAQAAACHVFNIRISKCGGVRLAARIAEIARTYGIGAMLGAQVGETSILSAAGRQFATHVDGLRYHEGSYGRILLESDIGEPDLTIGAAGIGEALDGPGSGVSIDHRLVTQLSKSHRDLIPPT